MKFLIFGLMIGSALLGIGSCLKGPPKLTGSYRAYGEIVESLPDTGNIVLQMFFEENYDSSTGNLEFAVKELGKLVLFIENKMTKQTFRYVDNTCEETSEEEWLETESPPALSRYESLNGSIRFSMGQLFALDDKFLKAEDIPAEIRGIPAKKWIYEIQGTDNDTEFKVEVDAYWSDSKSDWSLTSSSSKGSIPLGYEVRKVVRSPVRMSIHEQYINVFGFLKDSVDKLVFEAKQGIICPNRKPSHKFPRIDNYKAVTFHTEVIFPDYQDIKTVDGWYDTKNKLLRMQMDRVTDERFNSKFGRRYVSEMISGNLGAVFRVNWFMGKSECIVSSTVDYKFDIQNLINPKLQDWSMEKAFGLNDTNYIYIGKNSRRNIPCHVFQGIRKDWPEPSAQVTSLWEWCIAMHLTDDDEDIIFRDNELPLVSVQITVLENEIKSRGFTPGFQIIHHFYDVKVEDPDVMDLVNFDIRYCFQKEERRELQFAVNVKITEDNKDMIENATSDVNFLKTWKLQILRAADLEPESMRISKMESTVSDNKLYIKFMLLGLHKDLPKTAKENKKSLAEAEKSLKDVIDKEELSVKYKPTAKSEVITLTSTKGSLTEQINKTLIVTLPTIAPTLATTPSTDGPSGFSIVTDPDDNKSTKSPVKIVLTGHQPSTVAAVTIIMLLMGITIGSAGTFVKFNGLPACMRRR